MSHRRTLIRPYRLNRIWSTTPPGPTLVSIAVTPANATITAPPPMSTLQYTATGTYSDSSTANITSSVTWESSDPSKATIATGHGYRVTPGLATSVAAGPTNISATLGGITGSTPLTVLPAPFIATLPLSISVGAGPDLVFVPSSGLSNPCSWACRPSAGRSASNAMYNPGGQTTQMATGLLDGKTTLIQASPTSASADRLVTYLADFSSTVKANQIIASTNSDTVAAAEYTMWLLCRPVAGGVAGSILGMNGDGRLDCPMSTIGGTTFVHNTWFSTDSVSCTVPPSGWRVVWARFSTALSLIEAACNSDAWATAGAGLNFFPNGMSGQPMSFGKVNSNNSLEIADCGIMPSRLSDPDRLSVMTELRALYPSAGI